jgi:polyhydroxyalkanoate synthesis regulator protein
MVPGYLQFSLENLAKEQEKFRALFANAFSNPAAAFEAYQDQARKNMAMFEQALSMWSPFTGLPGAKRGDEPGAGKGEAEKKGPAAKSGPDDISELKAQLASMQQKIDKLSKSED